MISVIILAAGFGTRMKSNTPKVLHKLCGRSMLHYIIDVALNISDDVNIVLFNQHDLVKNEIEKYYGANKITFHIQHYEKFKGTGGALMNQNAKFIGAKHDFVLILNGDTPLIEDSELKTFCNYAVKNDIDILLGTSIASDPSNYGRVIIKNNELIKIIEHKDANDEELKINTINSGIYLCKKEILESSLPQLKDNNAQNEFYLTDIIAINQKSKKLQSYMLDFKNCIGINSKLDLANVENILLDNIRQKAMQNGVIMHMPSSIYIDYDVKFYGECEIQSNSTIKGKSEIKDSIIKSNTTIIDSKIENSDIGPNAHIRPNCVVKDSHIGNFVECKNAKLNNIKAGHLSYLGDCEIHENTNIGAGVIICNYDGTKKHKTTIGKNVFVGSNCELISPLNIECNVLIAAGSTVTGNAKTGDLVISRKKQENIENGYFRFFKNKK